MSKPVYDETPYSESNNNLDNIEPVFKNHFFTPADPISDEDGYDEEEDDYEDEEDDYDDEEEDDYEDEEDDYDEEDDDEDEEDED
jgi:hypothetical protein